MLRQFPHHDRLYQLALDDLVPHLVQEHQSHLDVVHRSQYPLHLGEVRLDEELRFPLHLGEVRPDEVLRLHLGAVRPDVLGDPCPGLRRKDCCLGEPLDAGCPCPGSKKMDCCLGEEFPPKESVRQGLQVQQVLESLLLEQARQALALLEQGPKGLVPQRRVQEQRLALQPLSSGPSRP
jgi:hypothetical protein